MDIRECLGTLCVVIEESVLLDDLLTLILLVVCQIFRFEICH